MFLYQTKSYNCGPFCALYILRRFGISTSEERIDAIEALAETDRYGTDNDGLEKIFKYFELSYIAKNAKDFKELKRYLPAIVYTKVYKDDHFIVVESVYNGCVVYYDPWTGGFMSMAIDRFIKYWEQDDKWFLHVFNVQDNGE